MPPPTATPGLAAELPEPPAPTPKRSAHEEAQQIIADFVSGKDSAEWAWQKYRNNAYYSELSKEEILALYGEFLETPGLDGETKRAVLFFMASILSKEIGDPEAALAAAERARAQRPEGAIDPAADHWIAWIHREAGDHETADALYWELASVPLEELEGLPDSEVDLVLGRTATDIAGWAVEPREMERAEQLAAASLERALAYMELHPENLYQPQSILTLYGARLGLWHRMGRGREDILALREETYQYYGRAMTEMARQADPTDPRDHAALEAMNRLLHGIESGLQDLVQGMPTPNPFAIPATSGHQSAPGETP